MQKLEDFLYDFIGIFVPGFFLVSSSWVTTIFLVKIEVLNVIYRWFPLHTALITHPSYPLIKVIVQQKGLLLLMFIVGCYIIGLLLSLFAEQYLKDKNEIVKVYDENKELQADVEKKLSVLCKVDWTKVKDCNKWIVFYRWANIVAMSKEEKSSLQLLLSKTIFCRSLSFALKLLSIYTVILIVYSIVVLLNVPSYPLIAYAFICIVYLLGCWILSFFFLKIYKGSRKILYNESLLVLYKANRGEMKRGRR